MDYFLLIPLFFNSLIAIFRNHIPKEKSSLITGLLSVILVVGTGGQVYQIRSKNNKEWQSKWSGKLQSSVRSTAKVPVLMLGGTKNGIPQTSDPSTPIITLGSDPIYIRLINGKALLSVPIRDKNGNLIGLIKDNEWTVVQLNAFDRNFNQDTLEILDSTGEKVFQVHIEGEKVYLAGFFAYTRNFIGPWINETPCQKDTLFRYPSSLHPGEFTPVTKCEEQVQ